MYVYYKCSNSISTADCNALLYMLVLMIAIAILGFMNAVAPVPTQADYHQAAARSSSISRPTLSAPPGKKDSPTLLVLLQVVSAMPKSSSVSTLGTRSRTEWADL